MFRKMLKICFAMAELKPYPVWDVPTRLFHWLNVLCVLGLVGSGLVILYASDLGLDSNGKILLKTVHAGIGSIFAVNLLWRLSWAFFGNRYARWRAFLPGGAGFLSTLRAYLAGFIAGESQNYLGHNPAGRVGITLLLLLMLVQAITGIILAGTDLFWPPLGSWVAQWIAAPGVEPTTLQPYAKASYDMAAYDSMRGLRKPIIITHLYNFYVLSVVVVLHVAAVVVTEVREGGGIVSAMFTGNKVIAGRPEDLAAEDVEKPE